MSLPMHPDLSEADQDRIVSAIAPGYIHACRLATLGPALDAILAP